MLLRIGISATLIGLGIDSLLGAGILAAPLEPAPIAQNAIEAAGGIFLLAGLWTPAAGTVIALDEVWIAFSFYFLQRAGYLNHIFLAILTAGLAMVGPGAWSIDARLFGRTRYDIDRTRGRRSPH